MANFEAMGDAVREAGARFVALLRDLDPADAAASVPGLTWTVAETAVHMGNIVRRGTDDMRRADSLAGLAVLNDACIAEVESRDVHVVADALERELARMTRGLARMGAAAATATVVPLHAGVAADVPSALSYVLFDFLAHGLDIARATGREWTIDPDHAALVLAAALPLLGPWVTDTARSGPAQRLTLAFAGRPEAILIEVGADEYRARPVPREDGEETDPVHAFLALAGREPPRTATVERLAGWFEPI